jgi:hypothetical protein
MVFLRYMYTLTWQRDGKLLSGVAVVVRLAKYILSSFQKEFEDTKGKNRIRNSKTHRQHNAQKIAKHRATHCFIWRMVIGGWKKRWWIVNVLDLENICWFSLDCPFLITPSVFFNVCISCIFALFNTLSAFQLVPFHQKGAWYSRSLCVNIQLCTRHYTCWYSRSLCVNIQLCTRHYTCWYSRSLCVNIQLCTRHYTCSNTTTFMSSPMVRCIRYNILVITFASDMREVGTLLNINRYLHQ